MHTLLCCSTFVKDKDNMLENIWNLLDVYENVLFDNQDPGLQFLSLMECINEANFKQYRLQNEKNVKFFFIDLTINCCIYTVQKRVPWFWLS